jgi:hypothetical protein
VALSKAKFAVVVCSVLALWAASSCTALTTPALEPQYQSPLKDSKYVSTGATIAVRYGPEITRDLAASLKFQVAGSKSGPHPGQTTLADDHKTVIFEPWQRFSPGERVTVSVSGLWVDPETHYGGLSYAFDVALDQQPGTVGSAQGAPPDKPPASAFPSFLTVPQDIPHYTVTTASAPPDEGDIFVSPFYWTKSTVGSYLLILNPKGQLVYYRSMADDLSAFDFKPQPNGMLSYFSQQDSTFYLMDSGYQLVGSYRAGNGYTADLHDLQILPNGDALLMAYDDEAVDMSQVVPGGNKNARVTGLIIQELDPSRNVIFEWRSWDHVAFADSTASLTADKIDLVHGNALALATDGNLLLSSRNLSEITKINLQTGAVMWRFGGKANMFQLVNGQPFAFQHDVRQLANGDITIFDNQGTTQDPAASHAVEYKLDVSAMTATVVWDYVHTPPVFATFMGNNQGLPSGNIFISWGAPYTKQDFAYDSMTEVAPDGRVLFDLNFDQPYVSYRAFRYPWQGSPDTLPTLAFKREGDGITLGYSWNGATSVAAYKLYGGSSPNDLAVIDEPSKSDFETQSHLTGLAPDQCYFQVAALDSHGNELARSKVVSTDSAKCPSAP